MDELASLYFEQFRRKLTPRRADLPDGFKRVVCTLAYDGTAFNGWQSQRDARTIQDTIEKRLEFIFHAPTRIHGSGRTDAGVHATGQVFHFDAPWKHSIETLHRALRSGLPPELQISAVKFGAANFHARFSARGKRYRYRIFEGYAQPFETRFFHSTAEQRLDTDAMAAAAARLPGIRDFSAFSGHGSDGDADATSPVKDLRRLEVHRRGAHIEVVTEASGYLYKMVRRLVGGLMQVGLGRMTADGLMEYLEARVSTAIVPAAPARGLTMEKVFYRLPANAARPPADVPTPTDAPARQLLQTPAQSAPFAE
jgi:tRNA pseudouridine38-40 synthase